MNQVALRRLIGGSVLVWVVCTVVLMTHPVPPPQRVGAQAAPTAAATAEAAPEQLARPVYLPLVLQGTTSDEPTFPANPVPSSAGFAYRVTANAQVNWRDTERTLTLPDGTQETVSLAYSAGYNTIVGVPLSTIILFFGRQTEDPVQGWGVNLPADAGGYQTEAWVIEVAQEFIDGYERRYADEAQISFVVIGTSNGNFDWLCENARSPQNQPRVDERWSEAGERWGRLVNSLTPSRNIVVRSGNDIESWVLEEEFGDWEACGAGTIAWLDAHQRITDIPVVNFGSNAVAEVRGAEESYQWTQAQLFQVSFERLRSASPIMYCPSYTQHWVTTCENFPGVRFRGVTSENANTTFCNAEDGRTYRWPRSWIAFDTALAGMNPPRQCGLNSAVSSFFLR